MTDEPTIIPVSPGAALVRLSQVLGAAQHNPTVARAIEPARLQQLLDKRSVLMNAIEADACETTPNEKTAIALREAQSALRELYETVSQPGLWNETEAPSAFAAMRFPDPLRRELQVVDVTRVLATFSCPQRQILTTLSFEDAPGAVAYWLYETRVLSVSGEEATDELIESYTPFFPRLRLPSGAHRFRIESRDHSVCKVSPEFQIVVPERL